MKSEDWFEYESERNKLLINLKNVTVVEYDKKNNTSRLGTTNGTIYSGENLYNDLKKYIEED